MISITPATKNAPEPFFLPYTQRDIYKTLQDTQGRNTHSFLINEGNDVVGYMMLVIFPLLRDLTHIYIPYGPVLMKESEEIHTGIKKFLRDFGMKHNAVFTRLDFYNPSKFLEMYTPLSKAAYHAPYFQPRGEMLLDLSPDKEMLLANMHKKTRYNIRKSERNDLETKVVKGKDIKIWADTFIALNEQNSSSHGTTTHPKSYFKSLFGLLSRSEDHFIAITRKESHVIAINVFVVFDDYAYCPFGASNDLAKKLGAYYHIKWRSILYMKERGIKTFNWGGVSVSKHDTYLSGVTAFKSGFGGESMTHNPIVQIVHKPFWNILYLLRKRLQNFRK